MYLVGLGVARADQPAPTRPNVLLIITDDQGYGDLGFHGNKQVKTPRLDALANESARVDRFYVNPVCSPTRSSLLTGRYYYRTGVVDTFRGRSMMHPDEVTLAELLGPSGYETGIFGKWHLGDNAPLRPIDQGFHQSLVHRGGGIGQNSDPPGSSYFNPILMKNGVETRTNGYCSDVYTSAAIRFMEDNRDRPFFAYVAFNAPHDPYQVPDQDLAPYRGLVPDRGEPGQPHPLPPRVPAEETARIYAMVSNIDANVGRMLDTLDSLKLTRETIVIFMTDNGPQLPRYNAGMLDRKGSVHEGGIRVPFFVRWPGVLEPGHVVKKFGSVIDVTPTLLEACGVQPPANLKLDGRSLWPLLQGKDVSWPDRSVVVQWHRGDVPKPRRAFAIRNDRYKLVQPRGVEPSPLHALLHYELFDMVSDPDETRDLAAERPEVVQTLLKEYDAWFRDVESTRHFAPPRIHLGSPLENPVTLTRQDWRGETTAWKTTELGGWEVEVVQAVNLDLEVLCVAGAGGTVHVEFDGVARTAPLSPNSRSCLVEGFPFRQGPGRLRVWVERPQSEVAAYQVILKRSETLAH